VLNGGKRTKKRSQSSFYETLIEKLSLDSPGQIDVENPDRNYRLLIIESNNSLHFITFGLKKYFLGKKIKVLALYIAGSVHVKM